MTNEDDEIADDPAQYIITGTGTGYGNSSYSAVGSISAISLTSPGITTSGTGGTYLSVNPASTWATSSITSGITLSSTSSDASDLTIKRKGGNTIAVGKSIELILEHLQLIVPDERELRDNPALKLAYENYLDALAATRDPSIQAAVDSYHMIRKLTKDDDD